MGKRESERESLSSGQRIAARMLATLCGIF